VADVSVRPARLGDVERMTAVQLSSLQSTRGIPQIDGAVTDPTTVTRAWERAVMVPPSARHTVWVAIAEDVLVGLAALAPASDPDLHTESVTELLLLTVAPEYRKQGHGSRLLAATMDRLISDQQVAAVTWVTAQDDESRQFLERAGWGVDGAHRTLAQQDDAPPADRVRQIRLGTDLSPSDQAGDR
jgi:GNAT superfamily N-acetyltransferase